MYLQFLFFQAEDGIRDTSVTRVQTCALPLWTTYLAPFSHIDAIRRGDAIRIEMPYATFLYRAVGHRIVAATDLSVLRSPRHEQLELQACHPRFFATHRYIVYARLATVLPRGGAPYRIAAAAQQ